MSQEKYIKYNFLKNSSYAIEGLKDILKNETSFKIELIVITILWAGIIIAPSGWVPLGYKLILGFSLVLPLLGEIINSAIERVVDLVTQEYHPMAKKAKDAGSAIVLVSITTTTLIWFSVGYCITQGL